MINALFALSQGEFEIVRVRLNVDRGLLNGSLRERQAQLFELTEKERNLKKLEEALRASSQEQIRNSGASSTASDQIYIANTGYIGREVQATIPGSIHQVPTTSTNASQPQTPVVLAPPVPTTGTSHQSVFISYGHPDEAFARKLNEALKARRVKTWFFPDDALPGQKLHRMMSDGVNSHDRVILICSERSMTRKGVHNEIEQLLARECLDPLYWNRYLS